MNDFTVHVRVSGRQAVIDVAGELDAASAPVLRQRLQTAIADGATRLVVDLRRVTFIESVGLGVIIAIRKRLGNADRSLCLVLDLTQTSIRKVFKVTGLDHVFPIHSTPEAAAEDSAHDPSAA